MKFSAITGLLALVPGLAIAGPSTPLERRQNSITDTRLFSNSLNAFIQYRNVKDPSTLNWNSDGCTDSPENPWGWSFYKACYRHDFGYRNYKAQNRFTTANKDKIDNKFLNEYVVTFWLGTRDTSLISEHGAN